MASSSSDRPSTANSQYNLHVRVLGGIGLRRRDVKERTIDNGMKKGKLERRAEESRADFPFVKVKYGSTEVSTKARKSDNNYTTNVAYDETFTFPFVSERKGITFEVWNDGWIYQTRISSVRMWLGFQKDQSLPLKSGIILSYLKPDAFIDFDEWAKFAMSDGRRGHLGKLKVEFIVTPKSSSLTSIGPSMSTKFGAHAATMLGRDKTALMCPAKRDGTVQHPFNKSTTSILGAGGMASIYPFRHGRGLEQAYVGSGLAASIRGSGLAGADTAPPHAAQHVAIPTPHGEEVEPTREEAKRTQQPEPEEEVFIIAPPEGTEDGEGVSRGAALKVTEGIPLDIRVDLCMSLYEELVRQVPTFEDIPSALMEQITIRLQCLSVDQDAYVCHAGQPAQEMLFVGSGILEVIVPGEGGGEGEVREQLLEGAVFAEAAVFTAREDCIHADSLRCFAPAAIFSISRTHFRQALEAYAKQGGAIAQQYCTKFMEQRRTATLKVAAVANRIDIASSSSPGNPSPAEGSLEPELCLPPRTAKLQRPPSRIAGSLRVSTESVNFLKDMYDVLDESPLQQQGEVKVMDNALFDQDLEEPPASDPMHQSAVTLSALPELRVKKEQLLGASEEEYVSLRSKFAERGSTPRVHNPQ